MNCVKELDIESISIITLPVSRWEEYRDIRLRALRDDPQAFGSSYQREAEHPDKKWQDRLRSVIGGLDWVVFAESNGRLVGMLGAFQKEEDKVTGKANIFGVFVAKEARGKKVGSKMMEKLLEQLNGAGISSATLTVNKDQTSAVALYKKFGFKIVGQVDAVLGDGIEHTELVMEKRP